MTHVLQQATLPKPSQTVPFLLTTKLRTEQGLQISMVTSASITWALITGTCTDPQFTLLRVRPATWALVFWFLRLLSRERAGEEGGTVYILGQVKMLD